MTSGHVLTDSATMLRRNVLHAMRYPSMTLVVAVIPVIFYLIFVYVFGSMLGNGLPGSEGGRDAYIAYVTPGVLLFAIVFQVLPDVRVAWRDVWVGAVLTGIARPPLSGGAKGGAKSR